MTDRDPITERSLPTDAQLGLELLLRGAGQKVQPVLADWIGPVALEQNLRGEVQSWLRRAVDQELAEAYATHFPVAGARPEEYRNRLFEADSGERLLTGIRFRKLDLARPFVEVVWQDRSFRDRATLERVLVGVQRAYGAFAPHYVSFYQPEQASAFLREVPSVAPQDRLVAAPMGLVARGADVTQLVRVRLLPARASAVYERYASEYAALHDAAPELVDAASVESLEQLEETEGENLLFQILVDGAEAGVYALEAASKAGSGGYQVREILLYRQFRGQGLAPAAHVAACRTLSLPATSVIWGVIGAVNGASLRTALRVGRQVLGSTYRYHPTL